MMTKATLFFDILELLTLLKIYYEKLVVVHCSRAPKSLKIHAYYSF